MTQSDTPTDEEPAAESIAADLMEYLRANPGVCAKGNVHGWRWVRYHDGHWQATSYGGQHRLKRYVDGETPNDERVQSWLESKPVKLIPCSEAYLWGPSEQTVWEDAAEQDVFTDADRCFWCGDSERSTALTCEATHDHGEIHLCGGCRASWAKAGELVDGDREPVDA